MNLVGKKVKHKMLGIGEIAAQEGDILTVDFAAKSSKFQYNEMTFTKFLTAEDSEVQAAILQEFEELKAAKERAAAEAALALQKEAEAKMEMLAAKKASSGKSAPKKAAIKQERIPGKRMTFYVFQGGTFDYESRGGYLWAPISNKEGSTFHHWDRLLDVQEGDVIFHGYRGYVQAVSVARGKCYECLQPEELRTEDLWDLEGRRVDCNYTILEHPIKTYDFTNDILRLCNVKYAPFDKDGNGNMGYLYELNRELARIFLSGIIKLNPKFADMDYVAELLSE